MQVFQLTAAIQREFGLSALPPTLIHSARTIRAVAKAVRAATPLPAAGAGKAPRAAAAEGEGPQAGAVVRREWPAPARPLSANQEQMWLLQQLGQGLAYNMQV